MLLLSGCGSGTVGRPSTSARQSTLIERGIEFRQVGAADLDACRSAAARAAFPIPCPMVLPGVTSLRHCPSQGVGLDCIYDIGGVTPEFVFEAGFDAPDGYTGVRPGQGHVIVAALRSDKAGAAVTCGAPSTPAAGPEVLGQPGFWITCPASSSGTDSGHVALAWTAGGVAYEVSLHGQTAANRELDQLIASRIQLVSG